MVLLPGDEPDSIVVYGLDLTGRDLNFAAGIIGTIEQQAGAVQGQSARTRLAKMFVVTGRIGHRGEGCVRSARSILVSRHSNPGTFRHVTQ